ncbi:MAG: hypothetical protein QXJ76_01845 [Candidatus Bathyarchaeia archaeon]
MKMLEKTSVAIIVLLILATLFIQTSRADIADFTAKEMLYMFLSEVVELDLNKYNITTENYSFKYPPEYGGNAKEEHVYLELVSKEGNITVMGLFLNCFIRGIFIYAPENGSINFKHQQSTNAVDESRNILQRYKVFAQNCGFSTAHVDSALTLLKNAVSASSASADLYMFNNITGFAPSVTYAGNMKLETTEKRISWIYTEKGVDMPNKILSISYGGNKLFFADTWNLFTVGAFSVISEKEALEIAVKAADNYNLTLVGENGTLFVAEKPGWSNLTSILLNMVPGEIYNDESNKELRILSGGNTIRNPLALYPLWEIVLYFSKNISNTYGIAVGVWGDTREIAYITPYGYLGDFGGNSSLSVVVSVPSEPSVAPSEAPAEPDNDWSSSAYLLVGLGVLVALIAVVAITIKKRSR